MPRYIQHLPIIAQKDINYSPNIQCDTFRVRRGYSVSGDPNPGKEYTRDEALLSGLMESIEMSFIEGPDPLSRQNDILRDAIERKNRGAPCLTSHLFGESTDIYLQDILFFKDRSSHVSTKGRTNGLARGRSLEEAIVHAIFELIERHVIGSGKRAIVDPYCLKKYLLEFLKSLRKPILNAPSILSVHTQIR